VHSLADVGEQPSDVSERGERFVVIDGEWHGTNAFIRDGDSVCRTYFINSRGDEALGSTWSYLDMTALGRQEEWEDSPEGYPQTPAYVWCD